MATKKKAAAPVKAPAAPAKKRAPRKKKVVVETGRVMREYLAIEKYKAEGLVNELSQRSGYRKVELKQSGNKFKVIVH